jgi:hypothetical protein
VAEALAEAIDVSATDALFARSFSAERDAIVLSSADRTPFRVPNAESRALKLASRL